MPKLNVCPTCEKLFIYRKKGGCPRCGQLLAQKREYWGEATIYQFKKGGTMTYGEALKRVKKLPLDI
jgi:uncharacterized C2H2 Zn-finger protein